MFAVMFATDAPCSLFISQAIDSFHIYKQWKNSTTLSISSHRISSHGPRILMLKT